MTLAIGRPELIFLFSGKFYFKYPTDYDYILIYYTSFRKYSWVEVYNTVLLHEVQNIFNKGQKYKKQFYDQMNDENEIQNMSLIYQHNLGLIIKNNNKTQYLRIPRWFYIFLFS